jgi:hypothetical protein
MPSILQFIIETTKPTMPKVQFQNHNTREVQNSKINFALDLLHKLVSLHMKLFFVPNLLHQKKMVLVTLVSLKKTQDTRGNFFNLELKGNFEFASIFFAFRKCLLCLFVFVVSFAKTQYWNPFFFNFMNNSIREKQLGAFGNTSLPKSIKTKQNKPRNALDKPKIC